MSTTWPIALDDVRAARERIQPYLTPTPLRHYAELDAAIGHDIRVLVKHENHQPTNAFKVRNALAAMLAMTDDQLSRGVVAASRGNHGQGVAWAGHKLGVPVTVCVPRGNNPDKNVAMRGFGAELIEEGRDYDESVAVAERLVAERGLTIVHSTNNADVIAGAATITLEILEQLEQIGDLAPVRAGTGRRDGQLDAIVVSVGGGSQAVGALTVVRARCPEVPVYAVQAAAAAAIHDGWHAGKPVSWDTAETFADGLATRGCYAFTFGPLCAGLRGFVTASESELAAAVRLCLRTTHNLAEGAGAAGLAGVRKLAPELAGKTVAVILSGANIDEITLRAVLDGTL